MANSSRVAAAAEEGAAAAAAAAARGKNQLIEMFAAKALSLAAPTYSCV